MNKLAKIALLFIFALLVTHFFTLSVVSTFLIGVVIVYPMYLPYFSSLTKNQILIPQLLGVSLIFFLYFIVGPIYKNEPDVQDLAMGVVVGIVAICAQSYGVASLFNKQKLSTKVVKILVTLSFIISILSILLTQ